MKLINAETLADSYCTKMCAGKCSGKEKEKCKFMELLNEQPTAFDVDKIMEQVKRIEIAFCTTVHCDEECNDCDYGSIMRAIIGEIKAGGV